MHRKKKSKKKMKKLSLSCLVKFLKIIKEKEVLFLRLLPLLLSEKCSIQHSNFYPLSVPTTKTSYDTKKQL